MSIQGLRHTANFVDDQRPKNWREGILLLWPNGQAPLTGLTSVMRSESTDDPQFHWWDKKLARQRLQLDASTGTGDSLTVTERAQTVVKGHILKIEETGEIVRVTEDPSNSTTIPVQRGFSGTTATGIDPTLAGKNPNVLVIGTAFEEGSFSPTGVNYDPVKRYNFTQIFRNSLEMTRTAEKTRLRTGDQVREAKRECLELHSIEMEKAFWFGERWEGTMNGKPVRTTGGVLSMIPSENTRTPQGDGVSLYQLEEWLKDVFLFGNQEKMGYCGNRALLTIQRIIRYNTEYRLEQGQKEYGMNVSRLICPFGTLVLKTHPLFNYAPGGTTDGTEYFGYDSMLVILDMENLRYRYLTDSDTKYKADIQENDLDGKKSEYLTEAGLELHHPDTHFLIRGLTNAIRDAEPEQAEAEGGEE